MQPKSYPNFKFEDFLKLCPLQYRALDYYLDEEVIFQFLLDLDFIQTNIIEGKLQENEIFLLINQDPTMSISKFLRNYNLTTGDGYQLNFLRNFILEYGRAEQAFYTFIMAPRIHINYFKLLNDIATISIDIIDNRLLNKDAKTKIYSKYAHLLDKVDYLKQKSSIKLYQEIKY